MFAGSRDDEACSSRRCEVLFAATVLATVVFGVAYGFLHLDTRWWFDDDPVTVRYVLNLTSPLRVFVDPVILRDLGAGNALVPLQVLSIWFDAQWSSQPGVFYFHSAVSILCVAVLLFCCLRKIATNLFCPLVLSVIWVCLPSTLCVLQFISARHYIEGEAFLLLSLLFLFSPRHGRTTFLAVLCGALAMLSKEIYAISIPVMFLLCGGWLRRRDFVLAGLALGLCCGAYRTAMLGISLAYQNPLPSVKEYWYFIGTLPYTFTSNRGGYLIVLVSAFILGWNLSREGFGRTAQLTLLGAAILISMVAALYPVAYPILLTYVFPTAWYRVHFAINTTFVLWIGALVCHNGSKVLRTILIGLVLVATAHGALRTRTWWKARTDALAVEGAFFLKQSPEKLFYTEDEAHWFLPGLADLYGVSGRPFINPLSPAFTHYLVEIEQHQTIYRRIGGDVVPDDDLYRRLLDTAKQHAERS